MSTKKNEIEQIGNGTYTRNMWLFPQTDESHSLNLIKDLDKVLREIGCNVALSDHNNQRVEYNFNDCFELVSKMATKIAITEVFNNQTKVRRFERDFDALETEVTNTDYIGVLKYNNGRTKGEFEIPRRIARLLSDKTMATFDMEEMLNWIARELYCRQTIKVRKEQTTHEDYFYSLMDKYKFSTMYLVLEDRFCDNGTNEQVSAGSHWYGNMAGRVAFTDDIWVTAKIRLQTPVDFDDYGEKREFKGINHAVARNTFGAFSKYAMSIELSLSTDKVLTAEEVDLYLKESWTEMAIYYKQKFEEYMTLHSSIVKSFLAPIFGFESSHQFSKTFETDTFVESESRYQYAENDFMDWMILREDFEDLFPEKFESVLHCNTVYKSEMGQVCDLGIGRATEL